VGRYTVFEIEQRISVAVDLVLGRRGEADQEGIEILEDRPVTLVDRAVRLVDHDEIEMAGTEPRRSASIAASCTVGSSAARKVNFDIAFLRAAICPRRSVRCLS